MPLWRLDDLTMEKHIDDHEQRLRKVEAWIPKHDGRIDAWWAAQHKWNPEIESAHDKMDHRIRALENTPLPDVSGPSAKRRAVETGGTSALTLVAYKIFEMISGGIV